MRPAIWTSGVPGSTPGSRTRSGAAGRKVAGVSYRTADVLSDEAVAALFDSTPAPWAVANTIGGFAPHRPLADLDLAELAGQIELNLVSAALITKHALRVMQPAGT